VTQYIKKRDCLDDYREDKKLTVSCDELISYVDLATKEENTTSAFVKDYQMPADEQKPAD
jgi:hypothetical protein